MGKDAETDQFQLEGGPNFILVVNPPSNCKQTFCVMDELRRVILSAFQLKVVQ